MRDEKSIGSRQSSPAWRAGRAGVLVRAALSLLLLGIVIRNTDWAVLAATIGRLSLASVALVLLLNLAAHVFLVFRWKLSLVGLRIATPIAAVLRCYFIGALYNLFLPSNIGGDVARSYTLYRLTQKPQLAAASSIVDRYAGLAGLLLMAFVASLALTRAQDPLAIGHWLALLFGAFVAASLLLSGRLARRLRPSHRRPRFRPLFVALNSVGSSLRVLKRRPVVLAGALLGTVGYYLVLALTHKILAHHLGLSIPFHLLAIYVVLLAVVSMLPITINGIGLREVLYVQCFSTAGWSREASLTVSWVVFASVLLAGLPGLVLQVLPGVSRRELFEVPRESVAESEPVAK